MRYGEAYAARQARVRDALVGFVNACRSPEPLKGAMGYSLLGEGKRLRAVLLLAACEMAGGEPEAALPYACAMEMIHAYSLVHDDLPAMDDDDFRRGKPTCHKVYGEGMAVLAGDGLLSLAYEVMLSSARGPEQIEAMRRIARGSGTGGMLAGQCADLAHEMEQEHTQKTLEYIHLHKTADMFIAAVTAGLCLAGADEAALQAGAEYSKALGIAFQIQDDLLDIEGDAGKLGKNTGMDAARGKLSWPGHFGVQAAHVAVKEYTDRALCALEPFGEAAEFLRETALGLSERDF